MWNQIGKLGTLGTRNTVGQRVALTQICIFDPVFLSVKKEGKGGSESIALPVVFFGKKTDGLCSKMVLIKICRAGSSRAGMGRANIWRGREKMSLI